MVYPHVRWCLDQVLAGGCKRLWIWWCGGRKLPATSDLFTGFRISCNTRKQRKQGIIELSSNQDRQHPPKSLAGSVPISAKAPFASQKPKYAGGSSTHCSGCWRCSHPFPAETSSAQFCPALPRWTKPCDHSCLAESGWLDAPAAQKPYAIVFTSRGQQEFQKLLAVPPCLRGFLHLGPSFNMHTFWVRLRGFTCYTHCHSWTKIPRGLTPRGWTNAEPSLAVHTAGKDNGRWFHGLDLPPVRQL